jgi:hypothetical protein
MIHPLVKIISVDGFLTREQALQLCQTTYYLQYVEKEFGKEIENFNLVSPDADELFTNILGTKIEVDKDSGIFRIPNNLIHFEGFDNTNEWIFAVALQDCIFNVFEHKDGSTNALQNYKHNYRNLFEWDHKINYQLGRGDGILFRPWLFHSFDTGQIQIFRLKENDN